MINPSMKRVPRKTRKKSKAKKAAVIRSLRGKCKHLDLKRELRKSRKEDRQQGRGRQQRSKRSVVRETSPAYRATQRDLFESENRNGERLGYSPAYAHPSFAKCLSVPPSTHLSALDLLCPDAHLTEKELKKSAPRPHP